MRGINFGEISDRFFGKGKSTTVQEPIPQEEIIKPLINGAVTEESWTRADGMVKEAHRQLDEEKKNRREDQKRESYRNLDEQVFQDILKGYLPILSRSECDDIYFQCKEIPASELKVKLAEAIERQRAKGERRNREMARENFPFLNEPPLESDNPLMAMKIAQLKADTKIDLEVDILQYLIDHAKGMLEYFKLDPDLFTDPEKAKEAAKRIGNTPLYLNHQEFGGFGEKNRE